MFFETQIINWTPTTGIVSPNSDISGQVYSCPKNTKQSVSLERLQANPRWELLLRKIKARREYCEHLARNPVTILGFKFGDI